MAGKGPKGSNGAPASLVSEGSFPFRMLGFGLVYAWSTCVWDVLPFDLAEQSVTLRESWLWFGSAIITPIACAVVAMLGRRREISEFRGTRVLGVVLSVLGTLAAALAMLAEGVAARVLVVVAAVGTGVGPVILITLWASLFAKVETGVVESVVPASFVATLVCVFLVPALTGVTAVIVLAFLPLLSGLLLVASERLVNRGGVPLDQTADSLPANTRPGDIARMFVVIFCLYALSCILYYLSPVELSGQTEAATVMVGMLFAIALSVGIVLFSRHVDLRALLKWISVPFVLAVLCTAVGTPASTMCAAVLENVVYTGIEIIAVLYFVRLAQTTSRTATYYNGIGECAAYAGVFVGYVVGAWAAKGVAAGGVDATMACLLVMGAFVLVMLVAPAHEGEAVHAGREPSSSAAVAPEGAVQADEAAVLGGVDVPNPFEARVAELAEEFGLTKRETEIFGLLARGRSRPYIRDALVLSKNTVATHIRHIYEKAGIHSQQELLDLVEGTREP